MVQEFPSCPAFKFIGFYVDAEQVTGAGPHWIGRGVCSDGVTSRPKRGVGGASL